MNEKGQATLKICEQKLNYLNYSKRTVDNYLSHIKKFLQIQIINAIRFFYKYGLDKKYKITRLCG